MHSLTLKYLTSSQPVFFFEVLQIIACKQINKNQKLMAQDKKNKSDSYCVYLLKQSYT